MVEQKPMIYMTHPDLETGAGPISRDAFDLIYKDQGWVEVEEADDAFLPEHVNDPNHPHFRPPAELTAQTKDELQALAKKVGVSPDGTKDEIAKRVVQADPDVAS